MSFVGNDFLNITIGRQQAGNFLTAWPKALECGYFVYTYALWKTFISASNHHQWFRAHTEWSKQRWRKACFTDETQLLLQKGNGRTRAYWRQKERFAENLLSRGGSFGDNSVTMRAVVSYNGKIILIYVHDTLQWWNIAATFGPIHVRHGAMFQHDNASCTLADFNWFLTLKEQLSPVLAD